MPLHSTSIDERTAAMRERVARRQELRRERKKMYYRRQNRHPSRQQTGEPGKFERMALYLAESRERLRRERRFNAFFAVRTSWPLILDAAKYVLCAAGSCCSAIESIENVH